MDRPVPLLMQLRFTWINFIYMIGIADFINMYTSWIRRLFRSDGALNTRILTRQRADGLIRYHLISHPILIVNFDPDHENHMLNYTETTAKNFTKTIIMYFLLFKWVDMIKLFINERVPRDSDIYSFPFLCIHGFSMEENCGCMNHIVCPNGEHMRCPHHGCFDPTMIH